MHTIVQCAERGAQIVKQVLTFARGVEGERVVIDPSHLLHEMVQIAQQTFPKTIRISFRAPEDLWLVEGDPTQLHQILLNLCVNARDALPEGGTIVLAAENFEVDEHYASMTPQALPGRYVLLSATDDGTGIPQAVIDRMFEPFYTTKGIGHGSGLGLSTVLGIVQSHHGFIAVESEPGMGTTFKIFLPASRGVLATAETPQKEPDGAGETILVVDDEEPILQVMRVILEAHQYRVFTASDGPEALAIFAQHLGEIDLVLTDIMMPLMDGVALIRAMQRMKPEARFIASTGQGERMARAAELKALGVGPLLSKPYHGAKLLETLRQVLHPHPEMSGGSAGISPLASP